MGISVSHAPIVVVKKKDTIKVRVCLDLCTFDKAVTLNPLKAKRIEDILPKFHRVKLCTALDLNESYCQLVFCEDSRNLIGLSFEEQMYTFNVTFGCKT